MRKKTYHLLAVLTALLAGAALSGAALAAGGAPERAVVRFDRQADPEALTAALEALEGVEVLWTYDSLFSGAAIEGARRPWMRRRPCMAWRGWASPAPTPCPRAAAQLPERTEAWP